MPTPRDEAAWLQPFPDALLGGAAGVPPGPEARYEQAEAISLAFVTALQLLPPRQVAVLILRDVPGFRASEVAAMLEVTPDRPAAPSNEPAPASREKNRKPPTTNRKKKKKKKKRKRSWPGSPARGNRPASTRWWPC